MKKLMFCFPVLILTLQIQAQTPFLKKNEYGATQLIVNGNPFLMLAGEVYNSSGSYISYMAKTMKDLHEANLNSVFVSVSWEIVEPKEGIYDFTSVDELLKIARQNELKLALLWFGSWKNGLSPYAPEWVLSDTRRFFRVKNEKGQNTLTLSPFCNETRDADAKAFTALMKHLSEADAKENTVIAVQIENEVGVLGQARDLSEQATRLFDSKVPMELIRYLSKNRKSLEIEIKNAWESNGAKTDGTWTEVFGRTDLTDLYFMACYYSNYMNVIAEAGKKFHNIPMYANCWMPPAQNPRPNLSKPGNYPGGGPVVMALDVWKAGAPSIDILAPDLYGDDFNIETGYFHRTDNPLFIPETRGTPGSATFVFAQHDAISFSPFGIDNQAENMSEEYAFLKESAPLILKYQGSGKMKGFYKTPGDSVGCEFKLNDQAAVVIRYASSNFRPVSGTLTNNVNRRPSSYGFFIQLGQNEFIIGGTNIQVSAKSLNPKKEVWLKDAREGNYVNGEWKTKVILNGDEAGFIRNKIPVYRISAYRSYPSAPAIVKFKIVPYEL